MYDIIINKSSQEGRSSLIEKHNYNKRMQNIVDFKLSLEGAGVDYSVKAESEAMQVASLVP